MTIEFENKMIGTATTVYQKTNGCQALRLANKSWTKKKIDTPIRIGATIMTRNQGSTTTSPETVIKALIDQIIIISR